MAKSEKLDFYKLHHSDYATPKTPVLVEINPAQYLAVTGRGEPGGEPLSERLSALYNVTFTVKMEKKFAGEDYAVCKLEACGGAPGTRTISSVSRATRGTGN